MTRYKYNPDPVLYKIRHHLGEHAPEDNVKIIFNDPAGITTNGFPDIDKIHAWHEKNNPRIFGDHRTELQKLHDAIVEAIQKTDIDERELVAYEFETGSRQLWPRILRREIDPLGLFVASLVDAESPLVMIRKKLLYSDLVGTAAFVTYYRPSFFRQPVDKSLKPVDKSAKTVDKPGDKSVDIFVSYPQDPGDFLQPVDKSAILSTSPGVIHSQPVDNSGASV